MRFSRFRFRLVFLALTMAFAALAGPPAMTGPMAVETAAPKSKAAEAHDLFQEMGERLDKLKSEAAAAEDDDGKLSDIKVRTDALQREIATATTALRSRLDDIKARLAKIGDPPGDDQPPEATIVTEERQKLTAERAEVTTVLGDGDTLAAAALQLGNAITAQRRTLFSQELLRRTDISFAVFQRAGTAFHDELEGLTSRFQNWFTSSWKNKRTALLMALFFSLAAELLLVSGSYRLLKRLVRRDPAVENPPYTSRLSTAFWRTVIQSLALAAFLVSSYFFLDIFDVLRMDIAPILMAAIKFIGLVYFVWRLSHTALAADLPNWRLAALSNSGARWLSTAVVLMAFINGLDYFLSVISAELSSPVVLTVARSFIAAILIGLILILMSFMRARIAENGDPAATGRGWPGWGALFLRVSGILLIAAAFTGYVGLARFISTQIVLTGAVLATVYIGILLGRAVSERDSFAHTALGRYVEDRFKVGAVTLDQMGLAAGLGIYLFALGVGVPLILLSWGFHTEDLRQWAYTLATDITIGNITISLVAIFGGVVLFIAGLATTRWVQRWIDGNIMERSHVEAGLRNSVRTGIGYLGVGIAGLIGVSAAGINLSSLALVAGALSLGVGFGLQNIVSNFVSGLILLAERPFKVGDWVVTGNAEGFVKRISVRATEIETFPRQTIIVPNSELINGRVGNWTHRNKLGRVDVPVSLDYKTDPRRVMEILLEIGRAHPRVLRNPEPVVLFQNFGAALLEFELRVFLGDLLNGGSVKNDLRLAIFERLRAEGMGAPFPREEKAAAVEPEKWQEVSGPENKAEKPAGKEKN